MPHANLQVLVVNACPPVDLFLRRGGRTVKRYDRRVTGIGIVFRRQLHVIDNIGHAHRPRYGKFIHARDRRVLLRFRYYRRFHLLEELCDVLRRRAFFLLQRV